MPRPRPTGAVSGTRVSGHVLRSFFLSPGSCVHSIHLHLPTRLHLLRQFLRKVLPELVVSIHEICNDCEDRIRHVLEDRLLAEPRVRDADEGLDLELVNPVGSNASRLYQNPPTTKNKYQSS